MTKIFAHRGFSGNFPENTMLAFQEAAKTNCTGIELDIQLTKDGEIVIIHDETLERTTTGHGYVKDYTLAELKTLTANATFGATVPDQQIPTLREYFAFIKRTNLITNIELKTSQFEYTGIETKLISLVQEFDLMDKIWYSSFNHFTLKRILELLPSAKCGLLLDCWLVNIGEYAAKFGAATVNAPTSFSLRPETITELHKKGVGLQVWTPNDRETLTKLRDLGVDCIITNYPTLGLEVVQDK